MNRLWILVILLATQTTGAVEGKIGRLDPHGNPEIVFSNETMAKEKNCKICHQIKPGAKKAVILSSQQTCVLCHSKAPHSGAAEHMGRSFKQAGPEESPKIDCISCHSPHRDGLNFKVKSSSFLKASVQAPKGFYQHNSEYPLLKRTCVDCHKW